jgi:BirA family biotin operon repressor/biotin-[acetyl-CoA-carboxylase] ligase
VSAPSTIADLAPARVAALLRTERFGRSLRVLDVTDSTNDDARGDALGGAPDGHVVIADGQRGGRGSHGRAWASPTGTDLYLSIAARPRVALSSLPQLTLAVGLGVAEAVERVLAPHLRARTEVKWPNDVWLLGKKCAGILIEASTTGAELGPVVIGIGLNVNRLHWADELVPIATSLRAARADQAELDRAEVLCALLFAVEAWVDRFALHGGAAVSAALDARLAMRGRRVRCGDAEGTLLGVAASGAIRIATDGGPRELIAGRLEACP